MLYENFFKKRRRGRVSGNILSVKLLGEKKKDIIGTITITYCESHDLILKVFMRITLAYFLKTFLLISKKMGCCFPSSRNKASIEVIDVIDLSKHFVYLRPSGKLVYKVDDVYNVLRVDIRG